MSSHTPSSLPRSRRASLRAAAITSSVLLVTSLAACAPSGDQAKPTSGSVTACSYPVNGTPAKPVDPPPTDEVGRTGTTTATMQLASGTVTITLDRAATPCTVNSFVSLAGQGYFNDTKCHRLVDTGIFILQCGDPTATGTGGPGYSFADELTGKETYPKGTVAMANAGTDTNGSQFFFVWADTPLPPKYTVFGHIDDKSLQVITSIASQGVDGNDGISPIADATIKSVVLG